MMWFLIFIGANSMSKEIRRAIFKSRSKIKISIENLKTYKGYRVVATDVTMPKVNLPQSRINTAARKIKLMRENLEIGNLPDKNLDIDMEFEVREICKRQPYKMKISAWDMEKTCFVNFRLVKFQKDGRYIVFATNLSREDFSIDDLKRLYKKRWQIENSFREMRHSLGALHFHSKKDLFNLQEFFAHIIKFNLTVRIIQEIPTSKEENRRYEYEINFKNACHIVQDSCRKYFFDFKEMIKQISFYRHPVRPDRCFQRKPRYIYPVSFNYRVA